MFISSINTSKYTYTLQFVQIIFVFDFKFIWVLIIAHINLTIVDSNVFVVEFSCFLFSYLTITIFFAFESNFLWYKSEKVSHFINRKFCDNFDIESICVQLVSFKSVNKSNNYYGVLFCSTSSSTCVGPSSFQWKTIGYRDFFLFDVISCEAAKTIIVWVIFPPSLYGTPFSSRFWRRSYCFNSSNLKSSFPVFFLF